MADNALVTTEARMAAVAAVKALGCTCPGTHDPQNGHCTGNTPVRVIEAVLQGAAEFIGVASGRRWMEWAVAYGCPSGDPNECAGILEYDDEEDAREYLQWVTGAVLAKRVVMTGRWEQVQTADLAPGDSTEGGADR